MQVSGEIIALEVGRTKWIVVKAAQDRLIQYSHFSDGTRFDRRYMARIRPEILDVLK